MMLLIDLRRRRRVGDVVVALVDEVVRVGEHCGWCCETTVRITHGQRRLHVVVLRSWAVVRWWCESGCRYRRLDRRLLHLDRYDTFLLGRRRLGSVHLILRVNRSLGIAPVSRHCRLLRLDLRLAIRHRILQLDVVCL